MLSERRQAWQSIIEFCRTIEQKADAEEWEAVSELATQRQKMLEQFFASPVESELSAEVAEGIALIDAMDKVIAAKAEKARTLFADEHQVIQKRRQATQAYTNTK